MKSKKALELLNIREFVSVGTCDFDFRPNVAPKLVLKVEDSYVYLIDHVVGRTFRNLKVNPRACLAFMDLDSLVGYQFNGPVEIIDAGPFYDKMIQELSKRQIDLSVQRIIEGVDKGKTHKAFEVELPEKFVIFKVNIHEIVEIGTSGELKREKV